MRPLPNMIVSHVERQTARSPHKHRAHYACICVATRFSQCSKIIPKNDLFHYDSFTSILICQMQLLQGHVQKSFFFSFFF